MQRGETSQQATWDSVSQADTPRAIRVEDIVHHYGSVKVLRNVTFDTKPGEFVTLLGPSGSGKTTLLRIMAGLIAPSSGRVLIGNLDITDLPPERRDIGLVFQNYALFPHLSVAENIAFPLKMRRMSRGNIRPRVSDAIRLVGLGGMESRYPAQLSGGQQQRVALARAIVFRPKVLLLDEPLGSLDRQLRQHLGAQLRRLQREIGITAVYVTHDQEEAFILSNRVAVMHNGSIVQFDEPSRVYRNPKSSFVAHFVGELNDFRGEISHVSHKEMVLRTPDGLALVAPHQDGCEVGGRFVFAIRPEHIRVSSHKDDASALAGHARAVIFGGSWRRSELLLGERTTVMSEARSELALNFSEGDEVWVSYDREHVLVFPDEAPQE